MTSTLLEQSIGIENDFGQNRYKKPCISVKYTMCKSTHVLCRLKYILFCILLLLSFFLNIRKVISGNKHTDERYKIKYNLSKRNINFQFKTLEQRKLQCHVRVHLYPKYLYSESSQHYKPVGLNV